MFRAHATYIAAFRSGRDGRDSFKYQLIMASFLADNNDVDFSTGPMMEMLMIYCEKAVMMI